MRRRMGRSRNIPEYFSCPKDFTTLTIRLPTTWKQEADQEMEEVDQEKEAMQEKEKTEQEILRRRRLRGSRNRSRSSCYL